MSNAQHPGNAEPQLGTEKEWYSRGYLPHRDKINLLQSITFRLADSLPQIRLKQLEEELSHLPENERNKQKRIKMEAWLDSSIGCCALSHPQVATVVQETFIKFDGVKYNLLAWCIMPNHVHILIEPLISLHRIVQSWKSYTGRWALKHNTELGLGVPGSRTFWMREYWDRYIRDTQHLKSVVEYILNNPVKAGICHTPENFKFSGINKKNVTQYTEEETRT